RGVVRVLETGDVEELVVRNTGDREVFIQAGDIVKGGKQDRVLTVSMVVPPQSGDIPVGAFCVEQDRWEGRGSEKEREFSASTARLPSKAGRIALYYRSNPDTGVEAGGSRRTRTGRRLPAGDDLQGRVWASVAETQSALSGAVRQSVADERSRSSLQLSLENEAIRSALEGYEKALGKLADEHPDAVGYVFAVAGNINSGDEFGSAGLFRKVWLRQLRTAATEALASEDAPERAQPTLAEAAAFIDGARDARASSRSMPGRMTFETRASKTAFYTEMRRPEGLWMHRSFIAR
ncbi:MAG: hypothetical protein OXC11_12195, partial [Rhodospirillales bacterium]|nr:hypothetical protein [Rhodospirillales bacterium]